MSQPENSNSGRRMYSPVSLRPQMSFRLLCPAGPTAGLFIGDKGRSVHELRNKTGCTFEMENPPYSRADRVINVTGQAILTGAQDGLLRAYERLLELERPAGDAGIFECRLLCPSRQVIIAQPGFQDIVNVTGTHIRVTAEKEELLQLSVWARPDDVLIQITGGGVLAVKDALMRVSQLLQLAEGHVPYPNNHL